VLLQPEEVLPENTMDILLENMKERLNVYGLSDIVVREAGDLSGNQYILVEMPGVNEDEVQELLSRQGKFEAKVSNQTVFIGGQDITYVCRSADCSGIDATAGCGRAADGWFCRFRFSIAISQEAAQRQAAATADLEVITENNQEYLSEKIYLYLDDKLVDELNIGSELKGRDITDIQISGSGVGATKQEAALNSLQNMKRLQTILITGSLPVKINIIKTDSISPLLGEEFVRNAILVGLLAILAVVVVVVARYRKIQVALPLLITSTSEVIILLGFAAIANWNLDLAAIAGIIIAVGTGVDHQIVITDETLSGESSKTFNWKERIKNAFSIIMVAYLTTLVAMIPLLFAGAGLLKGFALTTIFGVSIGVLVSRPAYAAIVEILLKD
jgi:preprotein translocase subunit SecD